MAALPDRPVRVLHWQRGQRRRGLPCGYGQIGSSYLADQEAEGPAVGDDVVEVDKEQVLLRSAAEERSAQQRPGGEVKGDASLLPGPAERLLLGRRHPLEIDLGQRHSPGWYDALSRQAVARREGGAERLVAAHHRGEGGGEGPRLQCAAQAQQERNIVGRAPRRELVEEPEALLGIRKREQLTGSRDRRDGRQDRRGPLRHGPACLSFLGEGRRGGRREQRLQG